MSFLDAIIMGLVQGLTEFLPVSSSAHLVFSDHFLHLHLSEAATVSFDVMLHLGTLVAVLVFFRRDILALLGGALRLLRKPRQAWQENAYSRLFVLLLIGTVPAAILGVSLKDLFESVFQNVPGTAALLLVTAAMLLWITYHGGGERSLSSVTWKDALVIGAFQAVAILPGISRSGSTITGGLLRGLDRDAAPRFSFLLSVPIILAGGLFDLPNLFDSGLGIPLPQLVLGFAAAAVSGYLAVILVLDTVRRGRLDRFAYYCIVVGIGVLAYWTLLVPQPASRTIAGIVEGQPLTQNADGEIGPVELGRAIRFELAIKPGLVEMRDVYALVPIATGRDVPLLGTARFRQAGEHTFVSEFYQLRPLGHARTIQPGGETRDVWVILRNQWGIQNEVRLRVRVVPESYESRTASRTPAQCGEWAMANRPGASVDRPLVVRSYSFRPHRYMDEYPRQDKRIPRGGGATA